MVNYTRGYRRHRFPPENISHAVWLYYRFGLSLRDVEDLLAAKRTNLRDRLKAAPLDGGTRLFCATRDNYRRLISPRSYQSTVTS
jgi:hypothetical protein